MNTDIFLRSDDEFEAVIYDLMEADTSGTLGPLFTGELDGDFEDIATEF